MADTVSAEQRSANMSRIRGKNTTPELVVRRLLHAAGYRFRLHGSAGGSILPGKPDLVFAGRRKVIFINGCFWHSHTCTAGQRAPGTHAEFWSTKRARTVERDQLQLSALRENNWDTLVVWECGLKDRTKLEQQLRAYLDAP